MAKAPHSETAYPNPVILGGVAAGALVFCATICAYLPALLGGFIWNDSDYVTAPALRSLDGLRRIWTQFGATEQYYPLLHSAFWVQHRLWGDHPLGYHLATLLLHAGSAVLFALVLRRLAVPGAWLAALLFALHPVHVESVAWIAEQKNTLSLAFYLAATLAYLEFDEGRRPRAYAAALALFVLSLLCKTVTATLPAALLVAFWWRRGRLSWRRDVLPLMPWLVLGAAAGLLSSWVESRFIGAQGADFALGLPGRVLVAGRAVWFYAGKLVWPAGLNFVYPRWTVDAAVGWQWLFPLGVLAVGAVLWGLRRRNRAPLAAFLLFVGSLFPALSFVNLYGARYSWVWDHWQYLPDLGPLAFAAAGLATCWRRAALRPRWLGPGLAAALASALGSLTWAHCGMFHDDQTLFLATLARNPDCWMAHTNLGNVLCGTPGRINDAIAQFEDSIRLEPESAEAHDNLGVALATVPGRTGDAIAQFEEAIRLKPGFAKAHFNLGSVLQTVTGRLDDAVAQYEEAIRLKPDYAEAHYNLGNILQAVPGRLADAIALLDEAIRLKPDSAEAHNNLGNALATVPDRMVDAIAQFEEAIRLKPGFAEAHNNLGSALATMPGRLDDAIAQYEEALRMRPGYVEAHLNLAFVLFRWRGRSDEARAHLEEVLRLQPDNEPARKLMGIIQTPAP